MIVFVSGCLNLAPSKPDPSTFSPPPTYEYSKNSDIFGYKLGQKFKSVGFKKIKHVGSDVLYEMTPAMLKNRKRKGFDHDLSNMTIYVEKSSNIIRAILVEVKNQSFSQIGRNKLAFLKAAYANNKNAGKVMNSAKVSALSNYPKTRKYSTSFGSIAKASNVNYYGEDNGNPYFVRQTSGNTHNIFIFSRISSLKNMMDSLNRDANPGETSSFYNLSYNGSSHNSDGSIRQDSDGRLHTYAIDKTSGGFEFMYAPDFKRFGDVNLSGQRRLANGLYSTRAKWLSFHDKKLTKVSLLLTKGPWYPKYLYTNIDDFNYYYSELIKQLNNDFGCKFTKKYLDKLAKDISIKQVQESCKSKKYDLTLNTSVLDQRSRGVVNVSPSISLDVYYKD